MQNVDFNLPHSSVIGARGNEIPNRVDYSRSFIQQMTKAIYCDVLKNLIISLQHETSEKYLCLISYNFNIFDPHAVQKFEELASNIFKVNEVKQWIDHLRSIDTIGTAGDGFNLNAYMSKIAQKISVNILQELKVLTDSPKGKHLLIRAKMIDDDFIDVIGDRPTTIFSKIEVKVKARHRG